MCVCVCGGGGGGGGGRMCVDMCMHYTQFAFNFCCMLNRWLLIYNTYLCRYGQLDNYKKGSIDRWTDRWIYILVLHCVGGLKAPAELIYCKPQGVLGSHTPWYKFQLGQLEGSEAMCSTS